MKKLIFSAIVMAFLGHAKAQTVATVDSVALSVQKKSAALKQTGSNELKVNLLYCVLGLPEISYERLLEDNMGLGVSVMVGVTDDTNIKFGVIPHFRVYFGAKKASGFFIEGNAGIITYENTESYEYITPSSSSSMIYSYSSKTVNQTNFGLGAAAGGKFLTRNGFLGEAFLGVGRLFGESSDNYYPRIGLTIGKRF